MKADIGSPAQSPAQPAQLDQDRFGRTHIL
jgi:hypothetical protein